MAMHVLHVAINRPLTLGSEFCGAGNQVCHLDVREIMTDVHITIQLPDGCGVVGGCVVNDQVAVVESIMIWGILDQGAEVDRLCRMMTGLIMINALKTQRIGVGVLNVIGMSIELGKLNTTMLGRCSQFALQNVKVETSL